MTGSQAPTFEARIRESRDKDTITAPPEGSERATAAASEAPDDDEDDEDEEFEEFDGHLKDKDEGIDWSRLKKFQKPLTTHKYRKSWVYKYGYRVVERHNPRRVHWVCHWCFKHRATEFGRGIYYTTGSISAAKRHLEEDKPGHYKFKPGTEPRPQDLRRAIYTTHCRLASCASHRASLTYLVASIYSSSGSRL